MMLIYRTPKLCDAPGLNEPHRSAMRVRLRETGQRGASLSLLRQRAHHLHQK
jgi:hypothetical protein